MKIKTKIRLGLFFLLALILMLAFTGSFYVNKLADVSSAILKDNYESIQYTKNMIQALDEGDESLAITKFEDNLISQEHNITEVGEKDATRETRELFDRYKADAKDNKMQSLIRQKILQVQDLNMQAILRKNQASTQTTKIIFAYITILGTICFLVGLTFMINIPGLIADPIVQNITRFEEMDMAKTNFIATISHELKTPISSIKMSLKLLEDTRVGSLNEEQKKLLDNIKDDSQRLLKITAELLDMAQVESGNIQLNIVSVPPERIVEQAVQSAQNLAELRTVRIEIQIAPGLNPLRADAEKTSWVLLNYLTNAIRYSKEGATVIISVSQKSSKTIFSVQDFGTGIESQYLSKVFDRFFQVPDTLAVGSTGMGLAISKEIIERQGGTVSAQSVYGSGSVFSFSLT